MSVTTAAGFLAAGVRAGLGDGDRRRPDLALVVNTGPQFAAAGVFTRNRVRAAPVIWSEQVLRDGRLRAVVLHSEGANACIGPDGFADTHATAELVAATLSAAGGAGGEVGALDVAVCATGAVGVRLPMERLGSGVAAVVPRLGESGGPDAAAAIGTVGAGLSSFADEGWSVGGMAAGPSGSASRSAATLVVLTTDAVVQAEQLQGQLVEACRLSFDRLHGDGRLSTNDSVLLLSSGASGVRPSPADFQAALNETCHDLAQRLLRDEGTAVHELAITVAHAASEADAVEVARAVAGSSGVRGATAAADPDWGAVLAAIGTTAADFEPDRIDIAFNGVEVCRDGAIGDPRGLVDLTGRRVRIDVNLRNGTGRATVWTTDLTDPQVTDTAEDS